MTLNNIVAPSLRNVPFVICAALTWPDRTARTSWHAHDAPDGRKQA